MNLNFVWLYLLDMNPNYISFSFMVLYFILSLFLDSFTLTFIFFFPNGFSFVFLLLLFFFDSFSFVFHYLFFECIPFFSCHIFFLSIYFFFNLFIPNLIMFLSLNLFALIIYLIYKIVDSSPQSSSQCLCYD